MLIQVLTSCGSSQPIPPSFVSSPLPLLLCLSFSLPPATPSLTLSLRHAYHFVSPFAHHPTLSSCPSATHPPLFLYFCIPHPIIIWFYPPYHQSLYFSLFPLPLRFLLPPQSLLSLLGFCESRCTSCHWHQAWRSSWSSALGLLWLHPPELLLTLPGPLWLLASGLTWLPASIAGLTALSPSQ